MAANEFASIFSNKIKRKVAFPALTPIKEYGIIPQKESYSSSASCAPESYRAEILSKMESSVISIENQIESSSVQN